MKMNRIIDYKLITKKKRNTLEDEVKQYIQRGWQPFGSIIYEPQEDFDSVYFTQPMVIYEKEETEKNGSI